MKSTNARMTYGKEFVVGPERSVATRDIQIGTQQKSAQIKP
jgi:hypothetical protein